MWAPEQTTNPTGEGDPLFDYIVRRLAQSLNVGDVADFMKYADPIYPNTDDPTLGNGRDWVMAHVDWPGPEAASHLDRNGTPGVCVRISTHGAATGVVGL